MGSRGVPQFHSRRVRLSNPAVPDPGAHCTAVTMPARQRRGLLLLVLVFTVQLAAKGDDEVSSLLVDENQPFNATWAALRQHYGPPLDFWGHVQLHAQRVLSAWSTDSQCLIRGGGLGPTYEYCLGCKTAKARKCIDDMRANVSANVPGECDMYGQSPLRQPACCGTFLDENRYSTLRPTTAAFNDALLCLKNVGCQNTNFYLMIEDECHFHGCDVIPVASEDDYEKLDDEFLYDDDQYSDKFKYTPSVDDTLPASASFIKQRQSHRRSQKLNKRNKQKELKKSNIVTGFGKEQWFDPDSEHYQGIDAYRVADAGLSNDPAFPESLRHRKSKSFNERKRLAGKVVDACMVSAQYEFFFYKRNFGQDDDSEYRRRKENGERRSRQDRYWSRKLNEDDDVRHRDRRHNRKKGVPKKRRLGGGFYDDDFGAQYVGDDDAPCDNKAEVGPCTNYGHQLIYRVPARCSSCAPTYVRPIRVTTWVEDNLAVVVILPILFLCLAVVGVTLVYGQG